MSQQGTATTICLWCRCSNLTHDSESLRLHGMLVAKDREIVELRASRDDAHHVLVRNGIIPGADGTCRCNQCRNVAKAYAEAGYAFTVKDRWWEK